MFATEESVPKQRLAQFTASYGNLENKTERKQSMRLGPDERLTTAVIFYLSCTLVCLSFRVLVKPKARMGTTCYMTQAKGRTKDPQDRQT